MPEPKRRNYRPVPIADLLGRVMQQSGLSRQREHHAVFSAWDKVVPPRMAERARPVSFRGGRLAVAVSSAPLLEELRCFRSGEFLSLLNQALVGDARSCGVTIRQVDFRRA